MWSMCKLSHVMLVVNSILLFDCVGMLIAGHKMRRCYQHNMAQIMSARYGQSPAFWQAVDQKIVSDWASYHADLNFSGDEGIADMHEALFRVTRALFTIANMPEPPKPDITALSQDFISVPCDDSIVLPDVRATLAKYHEVGHRLATFAHLLNRQLKAITAPLPMIRQHIGADTLNHYEHDTQFFVKVAHYLKTSPENIAVITQRPATSDKASQSGFKTVLVRQSSAFCTYLKHSLGD